MTKKHFVKLAKVLRDNKPGKDWECYYICYEVWADQVKGICGFCKEMNPLFDREKFLEACGYDFDV